MPKNLIIKSMETTTNNHPVITLEEAEVLIEKNPFYIACEDTQFAQLLYLEDFPQAEVVEVTYQNVIEGILLCFNSVDEIEDYIDRLLHFLHEIEVGRGFCSELAPVYYYCLSVLCYLITETEKPEYFSKVRYYCDRCLKMAEIDGFYRDYQEEISVLISVYNLD